MAPSRRDDDDDDDDDDRLDFELLFDLNADLFLVLMDFFAITLLHVLQVCNLTYKPTITLF